MQTNKPTKPLQPMTATQSLEWFAANNVKGKVVKTFRDGQVLVEYVHLQEYADKSVAEMHTHIRAIPSLQNL